MAGFLRIAATVACALCNATTASAQSSGSAFKVNDAGWYVTNAHVVDGCGSVTVAGSGSVQRTVIDPEADLAAILIAPNEVPVLPIRVMPGRLGEDVTAIGYPLADVLSSSVKVTTGSVSSLAGIFDDSRYMQISAPVQPGNSGGPVIDAGGAVLGVASAVLAEEAYDNAQNVNFALKSGTLVDFLSANQIAFTPTTGLADVDKLDAIDMASRATAFVLCDERQVSPPAAAPANSATAQPRAQLELFDGIDFLGADIRRIDGTSLPACEAACAGNGACQAFTYNTRHNVCFLKRDGAIAVVNPQAVGGARPWALQNIAITDIIVLPGVDTPGGDYFRLRGTSFESCLRTCHNDYQCRAFAYVRETGDCWLKDRLGPVAEIEGVEFGVKDPDRR